MIFITGCVRPNTVKSARMIVVLLIVATWSSTFTTVNAEDPDDVALVGFDFENGFSTNHTTVITGSVEDEVKASLGDLEYRRGVRTGQWGFLQYFGRGRLIRLETNLDLVAGT